MATSSTLEELMNCVPRTFQAFYREPVKLWYDLGVKISHCQHALGVLKEHETSHTFPPSIMGALKIPPTQVCKEFASSDSWSAWTQGAATKVAEVRLTFLTTAIQAKISEGLYLESLVSEAAAETLNGTLVEKAAKVFGTTFSESNGEPSGCYREDKRACTTLGKAWLRRALALGLSKHQKELLTKMSKLSLKKDTDVTMRDAGVNDIQTMIKHAVAEAMGNQSGSPKKAKPNSKSPPDLRISDDHANTSLLRSDEKQGKAEGSRAEFLSEAQTRPVKRKRRREWEEERAVRVRVRENTVGRISM